MNMTNDVLEQKIAALEEENQKLKGDIKTLNGVAGLMTRYGGMASQQIIMAEGIIRQVLEISNSASLRQIYTVWEEAFAMLVSDAGYEVVVSSLREMITKGVLPQEADKMLVDLVDRRVELVSKYGDIALKWSKG